nr:isoleucine--tRNA ligase [Anaerolineae bacterium]
LIMRLVSLGHAARNSANIKVRQPLSGVFYSLPEAQKTIVCAHSEIITEELNVKTVNFLDGADEVATYALNPLPHLLGPRLGGDFPAVQKHLRGSQNTPDYARTLLAGEELTILVDGKTVVLTPEEVEVRRVPNEGYAIAEDGQYLAALDSVITDDLFAEGLAREFIRRVQTLRKEADYSIDDRIRLAYRATDKLRQAVEQFGEVIRAETLAIELTSGEMPEPEQSGEYEFDGERLTLILARAK